MRVIYAAGAAFLTPTPSTSVTTSTQRNEGGVRSVRIFQHSLALSSAIGQERSYETSTSGFQEEPNYRVLFETDSGPQRLEPLCAALSYFIKLAPTGELQLDHILKQRASEGHWIPQSGKPRFYPNNFTVINDLYVSESTSKSPYEGFKFPRFGETLWNGYRSNAQRMSGAIGEHAIKALGGQRPKLILEAGSFIGSGVLHAWQPLLDPAGGILICIDSWLGDINMRLGKHSAVDGPGEWVPVTRKGVHGACAGFWS